MTTATTSTGSSQSGRDTAAAIPARQATPGPGVVIAATATVSTLAGLGLGSAGRAGTNAGPDTAGRLLAALSELGSPWVVTAFVAGALGARLTRRYGHNPAVATATGGLAGTWSMVIATLAYYRVDGAGLLSALPDPYVLVWIIAGSAAGMAFGSLGADWAQHRAKPRAVAAAIFLALIVSGEACLAMAWGSAGDEQAVHNLHLTMAFLGVAIAALAVPGRSKVVAVATTIALAWPTAVVVAVLYRAVGVLYNILR